LEILNSTNDNIELLDAISPSSPEAQKLSGEITSLSKSIKQILADNNQATKVFIETIEAVNGNPTNIISGKLGELFSNNDCEVVDDPSVADYNIIVKTEIRPSSAANGVVYVYADISTKLSRTNPKKLIYTNNISIKGGGLTAEKAARKALGQAAGKIAPELLSKIN